jgi:hypothetical protein
MSITFGFHPATIILAIILAGILTWWVYRRTRPEVSRSKRIFLGGLRFLGLALVILLLAEPVIRSILTRNQEPVIALLIDTSKSLSPAVANSEEVRQRVDRLTDGLRTAFEADIRTYTFDSDLAVLDVDVDSIHFEGSRTDISHALVTIRDQLRGDPLAAVILVSDGLYNTGRNPVYDAENYRVPIHTVVVGDTTAHRDVLIQRVVANNVAYVNRELPVRVTIRSDGFAGQDVKVSVRGNGSEIAAKLVRLPEGRGEVPVDLTFTPTAAGFQTYTVVVDPLENELTDSNNSASFSIRVLTRKLQVLLMAGAPSPDVATLSEILSLDSDIEVTAVTQKGRGEYYGDPAPNDLGVFDAIILAGFPGKFSEVETVRRVADSKRPILFVLDHGTDLNTVRQILGGEIPAVLRNIRGGFVEASAVPTAVGRTHPATSLQSGTAELVRLPPLSYSQSLWEPTPDARTLATVAIRGIELADPLILVRDRAGVRTAAFLGAGLWRWRNVPEDLADLENVSPELISNLLRWMTAELDDRPVKIEPVQEFFDGGDVVRLSGQVYDESLNPVEGATVLVTVTDPEGKEFKYTMDPIGNGRFSKDLGQLGEGTYRYAAFAERQEAVFGADSGYFAVGDLTLEFRETQSDGALMREIASRSGGQFVMAGQVDDFVESIARTDRIEPTQVTETRDLPLRHMVPIMFVIISLFAVEWVVRKRSGMV